MTDDDRKARKQATVDRVDRVAKLLRSWDPLGVRPGELAPTDEYDSYAPHIVSLVVGGCSVDQLAGHLGRLRTGTIGAEADPGRDNEIAGEIVETLRNDPS